MVMTRVSGVAVWVAVGVSVGSGVLVAVGNCVAVAVGASVGVLVGRAAWVFASAVCTADSEGAHPRAVSKTRATRLIKINFFINPPK